ncbi:putative reverse transcriptase domain-containing protein [Tanacetum coccineum]
MLQKCHGHGLIKGAIIQIFYHGLDKPTQGILDVTARGIFLYKSPNQAFRFLDDKVLFNLDWSTKSQNDHHQKSVTFDDGSDSNSDNSRLMEKLKALTIKMDYQFQILKEEMQEMRKNYNNRGGNHASKNNMNDDTPMCERHEANYIRSEDYQNQDSHNLFSRQSHHDHNDLEKSLTELNNDVRNDLEDFKRRIRSMRIVHWKLFARDDVKTTGVLPKKKSKPVNQEPQSKTDLEKSITKFLDEQTDRTDPPPPQAHTEQMNVVFTGSEKFDDSPKIETLPPIIVKDKPIKTSKKDYHVSTQRFSSAKATDQTECHKCGKKGHFTRDCWSKISVPSYQSPFQSKLLLSFENKPEPRQTKEFKGKYHKVKAKLALLSSSTSTLNSSSSKNKGLIAKTYDWDDEEVSPVENKVTKDEALMALTDEEKVSVGKESAKNGDWTKISMKKHVNIENLKENQNLRLELKELISITETWLNSSNKVINNSDMSITSSNIPKLSETEDSTLPNQDTDEVPLNESQRNTTDPSVVVSDSSATDYDLADKSLVCSTPLLSLKKLDGAEPVFRPKTIKSILKSKSTFKAKTLNGITINEPSLAPARGKSSSASKINSAPAGKLKNMKMEDDPPLAIVMKELNELKLQINKKKSSYSRNKNA